MKGNRRLNTKFICFSIWLIIGATDALSANPFSWNGPYFGGSLGGLSTRNTVTWLPQQPVIFNVPPISGDNNSSSLIGGILAGYSYQFLSEGVVGLEFDSSWTNAKKTMTKPWGSYIGLPFVGAFTNMKTSLNWLPSIRGRLGYLIAPNILAYGAAGVAWANIGYSANNDNNGHIEANGAARYITSTNFSKTSLGYTVGGGLEWGIVKNLLVRAEYLFYQFNSSQNVIAQDSTGNFPTYPSNYVWGNLAVNVVRAGLVFKF